MTPLETLPKKYQEDYKKDFKFPLNPFKSYFYTGNAGIGKTFLALQQVKEALRRVPIKYDVVDNRPNPDPDSLAPMYEDDHYWFLPAVELIETVRKQMSQSQEEKQDSRTAFKFWKDVDFLVIDDFGAELITPYQQEILYKILDYRMNFRSDDGFKLVTVITSNYSIEELSETYTQRITSRILGMCNVIQPHNNIDLRLAV